MQKSSSRNNFRAVLIINDQSSSLKLHHVYIFLLLPDFHREKWIYVHKGSTKEVNRLNQFHIFLSHLPKRKLYLCRGLQSNALIIKFFKRHGYCTLGEAFNRLDFCSAIKDTRRFNYVVRVSSGLFSCYFFFFLLSICFYLWLMCIVGVDRS